MWKHTQFCKVLNIYIYKYIPGISFTSRFGVNAVQENVVLVDQPAEPSRTCPCIYGNYLVRISFDKQEKCTRKCKKIQHQKLTFINKHTSI